MTIGGMGEIVALAERCEAAEAGEQRGLLELAFRAVFGEKPARVHGGCDLLDLWLARHNPFFRMLEAEAYESAALLLVPEGWRVDDLREGETYSSVEFWALLRPRGYKMDGVFSATGSGKSFALALTAAALRAQGQAQ